MSLEEFLEVLEEMAEGVTPLEFDDDVQVVYHEERDYGKCIAE